MATSIGQYVPVFLPENPLTEKSWTQLKQPCVHRCKIYYYYYYYYYYYLPMAALPQGGLSVKVAQLLDLWGHWQHRVCRGHGLPPPQELWPYKSLFSGLL